MAEWMETATPKGKPIVWNPFRLKAAQKLLADAEIEVGVPARITWICNSAALGGPQEMDHEGPVSLLEDGWIELKPTTRSPGHLRLPIVCLLTAHQVEKIDEPEPEKENPFIKKAREQGD